MTNLETTLTNYDCYGSSFSGGTWLTTDPSILNDLQSYGFNAYGMANNHTLDFSYNGLISTIEAMEAAGLNFAGIGRNLYEAARPAYLDLPSGRVAFINIASTFEPCSRAGKQTESLPGRPGLNPLRSRVEYTISEAHMRALREIAQATHINVEYDDSIAQGFLPPTPEGYFHYNGFFYKQAAPGEPEGRYSYANEEDMQRTLDTIRDARLNCDYVVLMVHSHELREDNEEQPDYFLEEFCHACIDAGASAIFGGGTHQLKGVELYQGKPIFYSLGNFIFQNEYVKVQPADCMELYKLPINTPAATAIAARAASAKGVKMHDRVLNFRSMIPYVSFEGERCVSIEMLPLDLGFDKPTYFKNLPAPADEQASQYILDYLRRVSTRFDTRYELKNGLITIALT